MSTSENDSVLRKSSHGEDLGGLVKLYGLPYCDGTIAVTKWLEAKGFAISLHNYKTEGITADKLSEWSKRLGWEKLLNKRSTTWRSLSKEEQDKVTDEQSSIDAMLKNTSLIKRPVIEFEKELLIGFDEKLLGKTFG
jgi:Spx/MgsR family transcriptional regulator